MKSQTVVTLLVLAIISFIITSCGTLNKTTYFQNAPDSIYNRTFSTAVTAFSDPVIQPRDILQVTILTLDPQSNSILTQANSGSFSVQASGGVAAPQTINGFLVDQEGYIELPLAGKIKVGGGTTSSARELIRSKVSELYKNPVISVRFANFTITVLGEVARPSTYIVPNEKISVVDAIGMAGDLTIFGKRENIMLIRDSSGHKQYTRFNFNSTNITESPFYYLKQGDVIYVEANKAKIAGTDARKNRNITIAASALSLLIVILSRF